MAELETTEFKKLVKEINEPQISLMDTDQKSKAKRRRGAFYDLLNSDPRVSVKSVAESDFFQLTPCRT